MIQRAVHTSGGALCHVRHAAAAKRGDVQSYHTMVMSVHAALRLYSTRHVNARHARGYEQRRVRHGNA